MDGSSGAVSLSVTRARFLALRCSSSPSPKFGVLVYFMSAPYTFSSE